MEAPSEWLGVVGPGGAWRNPQEHHYTHQPLNTAPGKEASGYFSGQTPACVFLRARDALFTCNKHQGAMTFTSLRLLCTRTRFVASSVSLLGE